MDRVDELKGKARELERSDQPRSALDLYLRLARQTDSESTGALWAKIGDLQLQLGDPASAQESYSRAIELFSGAGQKNNAIAIALRRIRANGADPIAHLTLGELSLEQGYRDYARSGLANYARHVAEQGRAAEVIGAFTAFLDQFPDETRLWKGWVAEMLELGRDREAVDALRQVWEHLSDRGATSAAAEVREAIVDIDPGSDPSPSVKRPPVRSASPQPVPTGPLPLVGNELPSEPTARIAPIEGLEPTLTGADWGNVEIGGTASDALPLLETSGIERGARVEEIPVESSGFSGDDLPLLGLSPDEPSGFPQPSPAGDSGSTDEDQDASGGWDDLPLIAVEALAAPDEPSISLSPEQERERIVERIRSITAREVEPADGSTHYDLGIGYKEMGLGDESLAHLAAALEQGHDPIATLEVVGEALVDRGALDDAHEILTAAEGLGDPNHRSFVGIHYWLARCAEAAGNESEARRHFERVAEVDPDFRDTRSRLDPSGS